MRSAGMWIKLLVAGALAGGLIGQAEAQAPGGPPPAVGVIEAIKRPIIQTNEFLGRIEAVNRVAIVARVTAFLDKRLYTEGAEVKLNDPLYMLERGPFEADLASKKAIVLQLRPRWKMPSSRPNASASCSAAPPASNPTMMPPWPISALWRRRSCRRRLRFKPPRSISITPTSALPSTARSDGLAVTEGNVVNPSAGTLTTIVIRTRCM